MKENRGFLEDLLLTVPYLQDYAMIDWWIAAFYFVGLITMTKKRPLGLFLLSISDFCWMAYDLSLEEYAQAIVFAIGSSAWCILALSAKKEQSKANA